MIRTLRNLRRLFSIARTLAHHDALFVLDEMDVAPALTFLAGFLPRRRRDGRPGQRLARALNEAGPSFIKLGQMLSTRSDLLGEEMTADLSELQDRVAPFSAAEAKRAICDEFGVATDELFRDFDDTPIAAASIAQVHFAVTKDGREVAVKVLRPGIEDAFRRDLDLFFWLAELIETLKPKWRRLKPVKSVQTLAETVRMEMDLRFEAAACAEIGKNFEDDDTYTVPRVDWPLTGRRVLTTERLSGIPIDDVDAIVGAGHDPKVILQRAADAFFHQVFRDGFFHGDLHPGNMFVVADGSVGVVDFGIMGRLNMATRRHLGEMLLGFLNRDYVRVSELHFEAGWVPGTQSPDTFTQALRSIADPILDRPQNEISIARLLGQLFHVAETFEMEVQPQLLLLQKTMLVSEGTGRLLCPDANMWFLARPLIEDWMRRALGPEARIRDAVADGAEALRRLPGLLVALEAGAREWAEKGLRLHPDTVQALRNEPRAGLPGGALPWLQPALLGLIALLLFLILLG